MAITGIPILSMLRTRMQWHQERQRVLADNVANAETPNFSPHDLAEPTFPNQPSLALVRTQPGHQADGEAPAAFARTGSAFQVRPSGNAVSLEDEMMKVADNQISLQAASALYSKSLGLIKIAIDKK